MDLKERARELPERPGVYLMKDSLGNVIYVGKSKNLRSRVSQYFMNAKKHSPKVVKMVGNIKEFEYILTDTEFEALLLECRLIKEIRPRYNSQMKKDKGYVYIGINMNEEFPGFRIINECEEGGLCFGPYTSLKSVERALKSIRNTTGIRHCSNMPSKSSGCLNYHLGLCMGPCRGVLIREEYMKHVEEVIGFFEGRNHSITDKVKADMEYTSSKMDFSKAAEYRDDLYALNHIANKQRAIYFSRMKRNIIALEVMEDDCIKIFLIQGSSLLHCEKLYIRDIEWENLKKHLIEGVLKYFNNVQISEQVNKEEIDRAQIIFSYLKGKGNNCAYQLIPGAWIREGSRDKLDMGISTLVSKMF